MEKDTVTRTFSIGAISGNKSSDYLSTERRHSSAGVRALLWATSSAKSFGCSLGSDSQTSRENIFPNILTPGSIPQFTIPSLSVQSDLRSVNKEEEGESGEGVGSSGTGQETCESVSASSSGLSSTTSSSGSSSALSVRKAERSISDPFIQRRSLLLREGSYPLPEAQHSLDPASRAALSLPHLAKVTTPYGFISLSQSPQMANEEALLCQAGPRLLTRDEGAPGCVGKAPEKKKVDMKVNFSHISGAKKRLSKDSTDSRTKGQSVNTELKSSPASSSNTTASAARHPDGKLKHRFYNVIKKHFTTRH
ncbi:unnamed protein product [Pleuronectes platessa]|uniref:Uncharacterized protein n=1 Tax=Pleuronectes platessa TaxID=8262 RepID=A0A9N7TI02_PLEPL|nr:unnamed protein product [Pleuronectes platessa]